MQDSGRVSISARKIANQERVSPAPLKWKSKKCRNVFPFSFIKRHNGDMGRICVHMHISDSEARGSPKADAIFL